MSLEQSQHHQNLSHNTVQNGSYGIFGTVENLSIGNSVSPEEKNEEEAKACRDALFVSNPVVDREELISAKGLRVNGTCEWIKEDKNFRALKEGEISLVWITGEPGKGKTMLSIYITEDLERMYNGSNNEQGKVIYHFCVHKKSDTGIALLRGLLYQILDQRRELTKIVWSFFETPKKTQQALSSLDTLWIIFLRLTKHPELGDMLCVLDGLDECDEHTRRFLLPRIVHYFGSNKPAARNRFRLVVVSRALEGLEECEKIDLDNDPENRGRRDIQLFVHKKVDELFRKKKFDDSFRPAVQSALLSKAGDTFLWVGFVVNDLLKLRTWTQVQEQLKSLPDGLSSIYGRMLLEIPPKERKTSLSILQWVCFARRPLSLLQLAEAMALQQSPSPITFTRSKTDPDFVDLEQQAKDAIGLCGQILKLRDEEVTFVHKTARDFLLRKGKEENRELKPFRLKRKKTHLLLARTCFQSIAQSDLCTSTIDQDGQLALEFSPFLQYAIRYWPDHARRCHHRASDLFDEFCSMFASNPNLREHWWKHYFLYRTSCKIHTVPLLHMVSYLGITSWVEALLQRNRSIPNFVVKEDKQGMRPIDWALEGENEAIVEKLLAHTADINSTSRYQSLYHKAIVWSNQRIIKMLAERGADLNVKNSGGRSELHTAVISEKEKEILKLLVERGTDLESRDEKGLTPLHLAAKLGREEITSFLIEAGADVMARDTARRTVLHAACSSNMERVVRQLLCMGLDVKAMDKFKTTMLHEVARTPVRREDLRLARLLILKGGDVRAKNCHGSTPLHMAAASGNSALVRLFIEHGAEVNAQNRLGNMPLHSALMYIGYGESARILISNGADVNAPDDRGRIPLRDCIQNHRSELPIIHPRERDTGCRCVRWELDRYYDYFF